MADPLPVRGISGTPPAVTRVPVALPPAGSAGFRDVLRESVGAGAPLRFSAHALARLASRNITLTSDDLQRMNIMADCAAAKGAKQSLFLMNNVALVVSIKNRTIITAVDQDSMKDNVFTNIDSAAIIT